MALNFDDTRTLLGAIERSNPPTTTLVDTFFPQQEVFLTEYVEMEYRKGGRRMAPFIVPGAKGVNMARGGSTIRTYKPPMMRPKRTIELNDVMRRGFGENVYSQRTPEERAAMMRAKDMADLIDMCARRQEYMAAQLLINGSYECKGYADDGNIQVVDTVTFAEFDNKITLSGNNTWDNAAAKIYDDIGDASQKIRRAAGMIPTVAMCSANVVEYLMGNTQIMNYLLVPSRDNLALMSMQPKLVRPELLRVGYIQALNMEIYAYDGIYTDDNGDDQQYIPDNHIIIGVPGRGKRLFGAVTQMEEDKQLHTYASAFVPKVTADIESDTSSLAISSRCVLAPEFLDDWAVIKVK